MYPDINLSPVSIDIVANATAVYDTIYNPYDTKLLQYAKQCGVKYKNGLDMLVYQAVKSHDYWYGGQFEDSDIDKIIDFAKEELFTKW